MNIYQGSVILVEKTEVARDTIKCLFEVVELTSLTGDRLPLSAWTFKPGQFVSLGFNETTWRAYSIASVPDENRFELLVRLVEGGKGSQVLSAMSPGEALDFKGPFGHFLLSDNPKASLIFCGTGTGIAPLRSMILAENKAENPRKMILLYGGRNAQDIAYLREIETWSPHLSIHLALSRDPNAAEFKNYAYHGRITHKLSVESYGEDAEFYICGNGDMVQSVQAVLEEQKVSADRIFMERFN